MASFPREAEARADFPFVGGRPDLPENQKPPGTERKAALGTTFRTCIIGSGLESVLKKSWGLRQPPGFEPETAGCQGPTATALESRTESPDEDETSHDDTNATLVKRWLWGCYAPRGPIRAYLLQGPSRG